MCVLMTHNPIVGLRADGALPRHPPNMGTGSCGEHIGRWLVWRGGSVTARGAVEPQIGLRTFGLFDMLTRIKLGLKTLFHKALRIGPNIL